MIKINYLSHGLHKTGGHIHELLMLQSLKNALETNDRQLQIQILRKSRFFIGAWQQLYLMMWAFKKSNADVNITVARLALSSILRNAFSSNKTIIVLHYFDERDEKGKALKFYYRLLFGILKICRSYKVAVVAVAPFWFQYFKEKKIKSVLYFPNLFNQEKYHFKETIEKKKQIHLGQFSWKNDPKIFELAKALTQQGYYCFFATNNPSEVERSKDYDIKYFTFPEYLKEVKASKYTLALTQINEGWNRVAHDSLLLNTTVIGYANGGLGDLLLGSNSIIVKDTNEAFEAIIKDEHPPINQKFLFSFNMENSVQYASELMKWVMS